jgi:hypothetical protein
MLVTDEARNAEWEATSAVDTLAQTLHDELARSIKKLTEAREVLGHLGYTTRHLEPTGACVDDLKVLEEAIRLFNDATDVCFDDELPGVQRLVAEYRKISGYDSPVFEPCREEA